MATWHPYPDTVLYNGQVLTMDRAFTIGQAVAVKWDRIVATGSNDDVLAMAGGPTRRVDLEGRTVIPGLVDTHAHMDREGLRRAYPSLQDCRSLADVKNVARRAAADKRPGEWVVLLPLGKPPFHFDQEHALVEGRYPDRYVLDEAVPENPVWVRAIWGRWNGQPPYVHILNSAGLRACGITRDTPNPGSTVTIERDPATREPTGRILETHPTTVAEYTILRAAPRFSHDVRVKALRHAMELSAEVGTTSVLEGHGVSPDLHAAYKELHERGEMRVRSYLTISLPPWGSITEVDRMFGDWAHYASGPGFGDEWLKIGGVHVAYRGHGNSALSSEAAWPYSSWAGFTEHYNPPDRYRELCLLAAKHRLRVTTLVADLFAPTDLPIDEVLTIWSEIDRIHSIRELRWILVHMRVTTPDRDIPRIKELGAVITALPTTFLYRRGLSLVKSGDSENQLCAYRDYEEAGIPWAVETDNNPYPMMPNLWHLVSRREMVENRVLGPAQRLTVPQALRVMTSGGAYACFEEHLKGSLETSKLADLIVLSADPLTAEEDALKTIEVKLTMVGGKIVHSDGDMADRVPVPPQPQ